MSHIFRYGEYVLLGCLLAEFASLLTTVYLHRGSTHRSITFNPVLEFFMQLGLWLTTGIDRVQWVAVHLCHHKYTDKEGDPHSPLLLGFWRVQLGNLFLYRRAARDPRVLAYGKNIIPTVAERVLFRHTALGLLVGIAALWYAFGFLPMLVIAGTHTVLYMFLLNNLVNGWCHAKGYKNFLSAPAFNNHFIAWITMGEGLHNNHHHRPGSPSLRYRRHELDLGWIVIKVLCAFHLAELT